MPRCNCRCEVRSDAHRRAARCGSVGLQRRRRDAGVAKEASCATARVHYTPAPGARQVGLSEIPWVRGEPGESGLVALLWYWPTRWTHEKLSEARIFTGGVAPAGYNVKVLWMFVLPGARGRSGRTLVVRGTQLDGPATFQQSFSRISGPSAYASIIDVPRAGCWRLDVASGRLKGHIDLRAVATRRS